MINTLKQSLVLGLAALAIGAGCTDATDVTETTEPLFDADGKADGTTSRNPGRYLLDRMVDCLGGYQVAWEEAEDETVIAEAVAELGRCYGLAVNAAGWTIEWRNNRWNSAYAPGTLMAGSLKNAREAWSAYCELLDHEDREHGLVYCKTEGELANGLAAIGHAFQFEDDRLEWFGSDADRSFAPHCVDALEARAEFFEDIADATDAYNAYEYCLRDDLYAKLNTLEKREAAANFLAFAEENCKQFVIASHYLADDSMDAAADAIPVIECTVGFIQFAAEKID